MEDYELEDFMRTVSGYVSDRQSSAADSRYRNPWNNTPVPNNVAFPSTWNNTPVPNNVAFPSTWKNSGTISADAQSMSTPIEKMRFSFFLDNSVLYDGKLFVVVNGIVGHEKKYSARIECHADFGSSHGLEYIANEIRKACEKMIVDYYLDKDILGEAAIFLENTLIQHFRDR